MKVSSVSLLYWVSVITFAGVVVLLVLTFVGGNEGPDPAIVAAMITAVASFMISLIGYLSTRKNQQDLELLKSNLAERRAQKDARMEYEYEARKRLYEKFEPLLFQLVELGEGALHRIQSLARTARDGNLSENGWLSHHGYYYKSTLHRLLAPIAVVKLIQHCLTFVDLNVEPFIRTQYTLAKQLYLSFLRDFSLSEFEPELDYDPDFLDDKRDAEIERLLRENPEKYWRQGVYAGTLDSVLDALILREGDDSPRIMGFAEFEKGLDTEDSELRKVLYLFDSFHPRDRPVLWRVLITQAHLYHALLRTNELRGLQEGGKIEPRFGIPKEERHTYCWCEEGEYTETKEKVLSEPFQVAERFLREKVLPFPSLDSD